MASNYFQVSLDKIPEAKQDDVIELCINPDGSLWGEFQGDHFMRRLNTVLTKTDIKDLASQIADKASTPMGKNKPIISVSVPYQRPLHNDKTTKFSAYMLFLLPLQNNI